jgi:mannose-6-phosphate isomerase-like protein (cupin superfamily)
MLSMTQNQWIEKLEKEGVKDIAVVTMDPGSKGEHTHEETTIHVILKGELTVVDNTGKTEYKPGDYIEFPAGTTHSVVFGSEGLTMIVGTK